MSRARHVSTDALTPRYRAIISSWELFEAACRRPLPVTIRINTLRADLSDVRRRLHEAGIGAQAYPWSETLLRVDRPVGRRIEHWLGLFYIQEASQVIPVRVLDPRPDEIVLDLCSAPGGKSTQISAAMSNRGTLVANEPSGRRQSALLANINRLGALNVIVTEYRGESFPLAPRFDRVLVDAPCSAEGTLRKEPSLRGGASSSTIRRLAGIQKRLLERAYDLVRPGGALVYSTCTFAPEENEAVVAHLLGVRDACVSSISLPFPTAPGLTEWAGTSFPGEIEGCVRIYPHHLDSGGGFIARVERPT
jgi:NOL1/NOP2/sun family putative RNA methylase